MDPNLVQLAAAYWEAKKQLGDDAVPSADEASADEAADAAPDADADAAGGAEDTHEGLGGAGAARAKQLASASDAATMCTGQPASATASSGRKSVSTAPASMNGHISGAGFRRPPRSAPARADAELSFIAADSFAGARPGYAFRTGSEGTGYYRDDRAAALMPGASKGRRVLESSSAAGQLVGNLRNGVSVMPIGGIAAAAGNGTAERRSKVGGTAQHGSYARQQDDDSDSGPDDGGGGTAGSPRGAQKSMVKRKALPGRLRKKLARDRGRGKTG